MAGWHHRLDGHGFGWTPGVGDGQGGLAHCDSWGHKESDTTEQLNWTECEVSTSLNSNPLATWCEDLTHWKRPWCWDWRLEEKETTEDEMVGWHHRLDGREFERALGVGDGQWGLACCSPWAHKESGLNIDCGLQAIMTCHWRFMDCNKWTALVGNIDNAAGYARSGRWSIGNPGAFLSISLWNLKLF